MLLLKNRMFVFAIIMFGCSGHYARNTGYHYTELSTRLVDAVRSDRPVQPMLDSLAGVSVDTLSAELDNDRARKTFWINIYNAYIQILLTRDPSLYDDRDKFFKSEQIEIAGKMLSFDDIEHGIIRGSKWKLGLGFIPKLCVSRYERKFRTKETDPRIHFALNCGAKSCPPVAAYERERLDEQLDESTKQYLRKTTTYDPAEDEVSVIPLFSWFRGDWGGKGNIRDFLKRYEVIPEEVKPDIEFTEYDWSLMTGNYTDL